MKRTIADILIFKTPFQDDDIFEKKYKKILEMFQDYIINSWIDLEKQPFENKNYTWINFINKIYEIEITFIQKNKTDKINYFPNIIVEYKLDDTKFEKENIINFLNDNIKFIYNVYFDDFFVDYDKNYEINDINKWKKIDYSKLKDFDLDDKKSSKNKQILDSMMYIYYSLIKNIFEINKNTDNINWILDIDEKIDLESNLKLLEKRHDILEQNLINQSIKIKNQIDNYLILIN